MNKEYEGKQSAAKREEMKKGTLRNLGT